MSLTLSSDDLAALSDASRVTLSPLDFASVQEWQADVNRRLRDLLGADSAGFLLPLPGAIPVFSEEHDPAQLAHYTARIPPDLADGTPIALRMLQLGVGTVERGYGADYKRYLSSAYYNEYAGASGAHDTLTALVSIGGSELHQLAGLHFWHARPDGRRFGDREIAMLRLVFPALRAGVESYLRWGADRERLFSMFDQFGNPAAIFDHTGLLHLTPAMRTLLAAEPDADAVRDALTAAADAILRITLIGTETADSPVARVVRTRREAYRVSGCRHSDGPAGTSLAVVGLERLTYQPISTIEIREKFGLTPRQADVARLLAERLTNSEIAERLSISEHTARHHIEHVLQKLRVSRRKVRAVLDERQFGDAGNKIHAG